MISQWRPYLTPCFWLVIPILAMNIAFAGALPAMFQPASFNADIPWLIRVPENVLRFMLFALTAFLPMRRHRAGWVVLLVGFALYDGSWAVLILGPDLAWSHSLTGLLAPAYTPAIWLAGIALIADRPPFSQAPRGYWVAAFTGLAAGFLMLHVAHATLVIPRLG